MKLVFEGDGSFFLPPNQLSTFEHNGKKLHSFDKEKRLWNINIRVALSTV